MQNIGQSWLAVIIRELKRYKSRPLYILVTIVLPLISMVFFVMLFQQSKPSDLPVAVVNMDNSALSRKLINMIDATQTPKVVEEAQDVATARKEMLEGKYYAVIVIPKDFERKIMRNEQPEVFNYYNNSFMVVGSLLNSDIGKAISTFSAGIDLNVRLKKGQNSKQALTSVNPIAVNVHKLFNPYLSYFYYLATTFLPIMLLIFILMGTIYVVGVEFKDGTAGDWLKTANGSIIRALGGKLIVYAVINFILMIFMNILLFRYFHTPLKGNILLLSYNAIMFVLAYMAMGIFIVAIFPVLRLSLSVASIYSALAFSFSGLTFPYIAMYPFVAFFGKLFPFSAYLQVFLDQTLRGAPVYASFEPLLYLNLFFLLPFLVIPKVKKMCLNSKYWGKL